jgi:Niemann-Pick C1 protein
LGDFGGTVMPFVGLGGYPDASASHPQYGNATALVITYIINNHLQKEQNQNAMAWEKSVINYLKSYTNPNMTISFSTERSIQDELDRESQSDIATILISYIAMFLYITLTLGTYKVSKHLHSKNGVNRLKPNICLRMFSFFETIMVDMKFTLGIAGVLIVMLSVVSSIGLFSYFHVKATLIIFEVIPFLVLAVGVDNIFILVQTYQRDHRIEGETLENQIARIVGHVGPSMLLTSSAESLAFVLGALTPMPAVKIFSLYAAIAVFIDFVLQITCFVSLMTLDCKRELSKRYNLFCCIKSCSATSTCMYKDYRVDDSDSDDRSTARGIRGIRGPGALPITNEPVISDADSLNGSSVQINKSNELHKILNSSDSNKKLLQINEDNINENNSGILFKIFKDHYVPFLMNKFIRPCVIIIFLALFFTSLSFLPMVKTGLDQKLSMPKDSYVLDYFQALDDYLSVGVPVYFVVKDGQDYSEVNSQNAICSTSGCNIDSLVNQINQATLESNYTTIAIQANSWLDDYFDWLSSGDCCRVYPNDVNKFCPSTSANYTQCVSCPVNFINKTNRPTKNDFYKYLKFYLSDNPSMKCAKGGHAAYAEGVELINNDDGTYQVGATFFMGYHKVGITSTDFIDSLRHANDIALNITNMLKDNARKITNNSEILDKIEVFPYSVSYVFYEQYLTIWKDGAINLSVSLLAIFLVTGILLGLDFYSATIVCVVIAMIIVNMFGAMHLLDIELNAVSLVNIVMVK